MKKLVFYDKLGKVLFEDFDFSKHYTVPRTGETIIIPNVVKTFKVTDIIHDYRTKIIAVIITEKDVTI